MPRCEARAKRCGVTAFPAPSRSTCPTPVNRLFDQEMLSVAAEAGPTMRTTLQALRSALNRAHEVLDERPGTASALASYVLIELDRLKAARNTAVGAG